MSALITLRQREAVHILCDGAGYDTEGTVRAVMSKSFAIPHLSAVISTRGSAVALPLIGTRLSALFSSFDELVSGIEAELPKIVEDSETFFALSGAASTELAVIGWSDQNDSGMAFTIVAPAQLPLPPLSLKKVNELLMKIISYSELANNLGNLETSNEERDSADLLPFHLKLIGSAIDDAAGDLLNMIENEERRLRQAA